MTTRTIMVQMADRQWTLEALHFACALARGSGAEIALLRMTPVQHLGWLGTELGHRDMSAQDRAELHDYQDTAEDYGVTLSTHVFQYVTLLEAIADAAEYVKAQVVFAKIPDSRLPYWHRFQVWTLRRQLARQQRQLYTLDMPTGSTSAEWVPSILVPNSHR